MPHSPSYRRILHRMGYYNYQQGLIYRHLDQKSGWNSHLANCRDFIIKTLDLVKPSRITVLGSGWLMDLPISEIGERAEKIYLVDIVHPPEVIEQTAGLRNVEISEQDITGGLIKEVWNKAGKRIFFNRLSSLGTILIPEYQPVEDPGLVISLNIVTQLEVLPERLLRRKSKVSDEEFVRFRKDIQEKHIGFLKKHISVLITDESEIIYRASGSQTENKTLLAELPSARISDSWIWDFDLLHADFIRQKSQFKVVALLI